jgi:hypothetical protein
MRIKRIWPIETCVHTQNTHCDSGGDGWKEARAESEKIFRRLERISRLKKAAWKDHLEDFSKGE